jgi:peptidoglycan/LPS O-acetylase OafA/YrhL
VSTGADALPALVAEPLAPPAERRAGPGRHRRKPTADPAAPLAVTGRYLPALDGVRAVAVGGVLAYHLGFGWASGGFLGVDLFFVLSGFLITSLLLEEWVRTAAIRLGAFWARRARRLLPALFLVLIAIALFVALDGRFGPPGATAQIDLPGLRGDALATLLYGANWHAIFAHQSYFAQFAAPSPLGHTWSLAIEEQFYLVWPLVLLGLLGLFSTRWRRAGTVLTLGGVALSAGLMALEFHAGGDPTRDYFGTDTRIFDMLAGAAVAIWAAARPQPGPRSRRALHVVSIPAAAGLAVFWVTAGTAGGLPEPWMFRGGFLACAVLGAVMIADVRQTHLGPLAWLLARSPLRWIGRISYGIYLWHWPIFVYMTPQRTELSGWALDLVRVGATLVVSALSFYLVEQPIRRRRWRGWPRLTIAPAAALATAAAVLIATVPAVAAPGRRAPSLAAAPSSAARSVPGSGGFVGQVPIRLAPGRVISPADPLRVMVIGDSVMATAAPGILAALGATGEAVGYDRAIAGFGLRIATNWPTSFPELVNEVHPDLVLATWSWDDQWARAHPKEYTKVLESAVRTLLTPGNGVSGVIFTQFPLSGPYSNEPLPKRLVDDRQRTEDRDAWQKVISSLPTTMPGRVMYLPVGASILLDGRFSSWLPPGDAATTPKDQWVRIRMVDNVHLCPAGAVRYADAILADLTTLFHLAPPHQGWWSEAWTSDPRYNTPAGSCPDDHPPG